MSVIVIGPYTAGEIPPPLTVMFKDALGNPVDYSTGGPWQAKWIYRMYGGVQVTRAATAPSSATGAVTYAFVVADMAVAGDYEGEMWVGNGTNRYDSMRFYFQIKPAIAIPSI